MTRESKRAAMVKKENATLASQVTGLIIKNRKQRIKNKE